MNHHCIGLDNFSRAFHRVSVLANKIRHLKHGCMRHFTMYRKKHKDAPAIRFKGPKICK